LEKFRGKRSSSISSFEFEKDDIQREDVVREVLDIYSHETYPEYYYSSTSNSHHDSSSDDEKSK